MLIKKIDFFFIWFSNFCGLSSFCYFSYATVFDSLNCKFRIVLRKFCVEFDWTGICYYVNLPIAFNSIKCTFKYVY